MNDTVFLDSPEKGIQLCNEILKYSLVILSITETDIRLAIELFEYHKNSGISPRDAIHAATLKNNGITQLISADRDFDKFDFLMRIEPKDYSPKRV